MPFYRRLFAPGATYFFTVTLADRRSRLLVDHVAALRGAFRYGRSRRPFDTIAICVLPDHLHCIWTLPEQDRDFTARWRLIKSSFSRAIARGADPADGSGEGDRGIWKRRFWEQPIADERSLDAYVAFIHGDAVTHGHAATPDAWPYSSWHRFKRESGRSWTPPPDGLVTGETP